MRLIITVLDNDPNFQKCLEYAVLAPGTLNNEFDNKWSDGAILVWKEGDRKIVTSTSRTKTGYSVTAYTEKN